MNKKVTQTLAPHLEIQTFGSISELTEWEDHNHVTVDDSRDPVGDRDDRALREILPDYPLEDCIGRWINRGSCFVQD